MPDGLSAAVPPAEVNAFADGVLSREFTRGGGLIDDHDQRGRLVIPFGEGAPLRYRNLHNAEIVRGDVAIVRAGPLIYGRLRSPLDTEVEGRAFRKGQRVDRADSLDARNC